MTNDSVEGREIKETRLLTPLTPAELRDISEISVPIIILTRGMC